MTSLQIKLMMLGILIAVIGGVVYIYLAGKDENE